MARVRSKEETEFKFVDEIPPKGRAGIWVRRLHPLVENPGRAAQVLVCRSAKQAANTVDNLNRRLVVIPRTDHHWVFMSRENLVFAIYQGAGRRQKNGSVRRAK